MVADGTKYSIIRGSDVDRDGMYLELSETESKKVIAEVFYSDSYSRCQKTTSTGLRIRRLTIGCMRPAKAARVSCFFMPSVGRFCGRLSRGIMRRKHHELP